MSSFPCIAVDYPWKFNDQLPGASRGASKRYDTIAHAEREATLAEYWALVRAQRNACMFFWRVAAMQREAFDIIDSLGFEVKSELVWEKKTKTGKDHFGMGWYARMAHETCLICTRGRVTVLNHSTRSRFSAPCPVDERGRVIHSAKPDRFFEIVEQLVPGPRLELFARKQRPEWTCLGNEMQEARVA
jgi:N6-adenosine-specific RNA methylase IME4